LYSSEVTIVRVIHTLPTKGFVRRAALFSALLARRVGQSVGFATPKILAA
jgi:hypothetical protein